MNCWLKTKWTRMLNKSSTFLLSGTTKNEKKEDVGEEEEEERCQLRSYKDFLQKSLAENGCVEYKPVKESNETVEATSKKKTSLLFDTDHKSSNGETSSNGGGDKLVLIKYKSKVDGSKLNLQKKREIHSLLFFIFFLFVTVITLSQIIVMHTQTSQSNFYQIKLMQEELKLMDASIDRMLKEKHVLPVQVIDYIQFTLHFFYNHLYNSANYTFTNIDRLYDDIIHANLICEEIQSILIGFNIFKNIIFINTNSGEK